MSRTITVGTRGSKLALAQTEAVITGLRDVSQGMDIGMRLIASSGDEHPEAPIESLGVGAFTSAIEMALLSGHIDLAVHSLKDLPVDQPHGLIALPVLQREDARDVLVNRWNSTLIDLPAGARIGTSSTRRAAQLTYGRKDIHLIPVRGNVETRISKISASNYDGMILAAAGLIRLGLTEHIAEYLSPGICTPAPGQAAIAAEVRATDTELLQMVRLITHLPTIQAVTAERSVLRAAGSGCSLPLGAFAEIEDSNMRLFATVTPSDGSLSYRVEVTGDASEPEILGKAAFDGLLEQGAGSLLEATP